MAPFSCSQVRALFFDAVGTLIHPEPPTPEVYASVGRRHGSSLTVPTIQARFKAAFQREEDADRANDWRTDEAREELRWRRIVAGVLTDVTDAEACFSELFAYFGRPESWHCASEVGYLLRELANRGYLLGIASNFDRRIRRILAGMPKLRPLQHLVISSEVGWRKPAGAFFASMAQSVQLPPERVLHVGDDWANDYEGARKCGMQAVLFDPQNQAPSKANAQVARLIELLSTTAPPRAT
jgi:putative hydrolase of the HAD superfamily